MNKYLVVHGTPNYDVKFVATSTDKNVVYFTDDISVANLFANATDFGGLFPGEIATIIHAEIHLKNPLYINEDYWEEIADSTNIVGGLELNLWRRQLKSTAES